MVTWLLHDSELLLSRVNSENNHIKNNIHKQYVANDAPYFHFFLGFVIKNGAFRIALLRNRLRFPFCSAPVTKDHVVRHRIFARGTDPLFWLFTQTISALGAIGWCLLICCSAFIALNHMVCCFLSIDFWYVIMMRCKIRSPIFHRMNKRPASLLQSLIQHPVVSSLLIWANRGGQVYHGPV